MNLDKLAQSATSVPGRYWVAASIWTAVVLAGAFPILPIASGTPSALRSALEALGTLATLSLLAAPVLAFFRPVLAFALCVAATAVAAIAIPLTITYPPDESVAPVATKLGYFLAMVAVAYGASWRRPRLAWILGALSLSIPAAVCFVDRVVMYTFGYGAQVSAQGWAPGRRWLTLGVYALAVALTLGTAIALRLSATRAGEHRAVATERAEVNARAALARDLHDIVAHRISLVAVRAETAPYTNPDLPPEAKDVLAGIATDARAAMDEMRGVLGVLHRSTDQPLRSPQPIVADIAELVTAARDAGATVTVNGDLPTVDPLTGNTAYRVVQEALTNARRHAPGSPATIDLAASEDAIGIRVSNPVLAEVGAPGRGLTGMRERVELSGGTLDARPVDGYFVVEVNLPRSAQDGAHD